MNSWWITAYTWRRLAPWGCVAVCVWLGYQYLHLPGYSPAAASSQSATMPDWPKAKSIALEDWNVLQPDPVRPSSEPSGYAARRFRLAGTYFQFTEEGQLRQRIAYIEDTEQHKQHMLHEKDAVDGLTLIQIFSNAVSVVYQGERDTLRLSYGGEELARVASPTPEEDQPKTFEELPALETNRFGKRIGENRWVFKREALLQYHQELADDVERLAELFVSFKPDLNEQQRVEGYQLNIRGEQDFFSQVGLLENDIVREVNSMRMVSQKRAELFIREFSRNNLNMLVLDIERDGDEKKLIYLIR